MAKFNALLNLRLKQKDQAKNKMTALAERSTSGNLSSFSGVFRVSSLSDNEKETLTSILRKYQENEDQSIEKDLDQLAAITSEVKAITNQAVILHGERIKKAQMILKGYQEGAFTAWLITTYGNRQTPYNFLQYYEFYSAMPNKLQSKIDTMPRQAIYTLASREGESEKKQEIIESYEGQPKQELLSIIRKVFPLELTDKRRANIANQTITSLLSIKKSIDDRFFLPTEKQKNKIIDLLDELHTSIMNK